MDNSIYNFFLEGAGYHSINSNDIASVYNVDFNQKNNVMMIKFMTNDDVKGELRIEYNKFQEWLIKNIDEYTNIFTDFVIDFVKKSHKEDEEDLNEIIDDSGGIMADEDTPPNTTNAGIGSSNKDSNYTYKRSLPRSVRFSGDLGIGTISW